MRYFWNVSVVSFDDGVLIPHNQAIIVSLQVVVGLNKALYDLLSICEPIRAECRLEVLSDLGQEACSRHQLGIFIVLGVVALVVQVLVGLAWYLGMTSNHNGRHRINPLETLGAHGVFEAT